MRLLAECRPVESWPGVRTQYPKRSPFRSSFQKTMVLLRSELGKLGVSQVTIELDVVEGDIRNDGWPYASAKVSPPVKISFVSSSKGPLVFATDRFDHWHDNLRAIALGLEALRKVERYGITDSGDQYAGWKQLTAGDSAMAFPEATAVIASAAGVSSDVVQADTAAAVRSARRFAHPDNGGSDDLFVAVQTAAEVLLGG